MRLKKWNSRVFAFSLALAALQSFGAVYYVAPDGDEDCAECATYASLIVTGSVPVRFEKWNRNLFPEKHARIG